MRRPPHRPAKARTSPAVLEHINPNAAGIDCGASEHVVAVPPDRDGTPVQTFRTFTGDLERLVDWLQGCRVTSVALESTGVYWIPIFELLETRGFQVSLVNARHVKNVPGRKSDVSDSEWIRDLHIMGLLRASFRPTDAIVVLRAYLRHRAGLVEGASAQVQRMQKALVQMNVQLSLVVADITGQTGMRILRDIIAGRTDPVALARHRDRRCNATETEIAAALTGNYRPEHLFALQQHLGLYDVHQAQIAACDDAIEQCLAQLTSSIPTPVDSLPPPRIRLTTRGNEPGFDVRSPLHQLTKTDLSQIDGIGPYTALRLIAEIGTDMSRWPTEQHFTSWLTLAPRNKISGGRLLSSQTQPSANRAASLLRIAAMSLGRGSTALGAFYRRLAGRAGKAKAITATARKLAILVYRTLRGELVYRDPGADAYDAQHRDQLVRRLRSRASRMGFALLDLQTGELLESAVS